MPVDRDLSVKGLLTLKVVKCVRCYDLGKIYVNDGRDPKYCKCEAGAKAKEEDEAE